MSGISSDCTVVQIDKFHICNGCAYRNVAQLEADAPHARFVCEIQPAEGRVMVRDDSGAVTHCTEFSGEATLCPHLPEVAGVMPGFDCELGTGCKCVKVEVV